MLYAEDNEVDFRMMQHFLRDTQLRLSGSRTARTRWLKPRRVVTSSWPTGGSKDMQGTEFITHLRELSIDTPAIMLSPVPVGPQPGWSTHNTGVLVKPLQQTTLLRALAERVLLKEAHDAASSLNDDPAAPMAEGIIQSFPHHRRRTRAVPRRKRHHGADRVVHADPQIGAGPRAQRAQPRRGSRRHGVHQRRPHGGEKPVRP